MMKKIFKLFIFMILMMPVMVSANTLTVKVTDSQSGKVLENTVFKVYKNDVEVGQINTSSNGEGSISNLSSDEYIVKAVMVPRGYTLSEKEYSVDLKSGDKSIGIKIDPKESTIENVDTGNAYPVQITGIILIGALVTLYFLLKRQSLSKL